MKWVTGLITVTLNIDYLWLLIDIMTSFYNVI